MGVHDYTCSVCGTPSTYRCGEATGETCEQDGIGDDSVFVDLFFFRVDDAPEDGDAFEAQVPRAVAVIEQKRGFDWGEWEFVPSLNYRTLLMDDEDPTGIWRVRPFEDGDEGSAIEDLEVPTGRIVWAVNYCPSCRERFVGAGAPAAAPCRLYCEQIVEHLGLRIDSGDKDKLLAEVREIVARRRPTPRQAG